MKFNLDTAFQELIQSVNGNGENPRTPITDTGKYDEVKEKAIRDLAQKLSYYAESGPLFDPTGHYLCGDCALREEPKSCSHVSGKISMQTGSCMIWIRGDEINLACGQKLTQIEANYATRPAGFGCSRCSWGSKAKKADSAGRPSWCSWWGMRILPDACCLANSGSDMKVAPGE